jgi:hypothetical protein
LGAGGRRLTASTFSLCLILGSNFFAERSQFEKMSEADVPPTEDQYLAAFLYEVWTQIETPPLRFRNRDRALLQMMWANDYRHR